MNKASRLKPFALFLLSVLSIAFQLWVMRVFSIGSWSNFGAMIISIALLGFGLAGTLLTFLQDSVKKNADRWLFLTSALMLPAMVLSHSLAQMVSFNPSFITSDPTQILMIIAFYLLYAVPFFLTAIFIGVIFIDQETRIHSLYFWNMVGSGIGGFVLLALTYILPTTYQILPLIGLGFFITLITGFSFIQKQIWTKILKWSALGVIVLFSVLVSVFWGEIKVSSFKSVSYIKNFPEKELVYTGYGPEGEFEIYDSPALHFAPGLSDMASFYVEKMPVKAFWGLYINGSGPIGIMKDIKDPIEKAYMDFIPMKAPYLLLQDPEVLLLKLGGAIGVHTALHNNAKTVDVAESSQTMINLMMNNPRVKEFIGDVLRNPKVNVIPKEPRAFTFQTEKKYDLVELSLIDGIGLSQTGGYSVDENYTYTAEGIASYLKALKPNGILSMTVWNNLTPPKNVPKLYTSVVEALKLIGVKNPEKRVFAFDVLLSTATILVKNSDLTEQEIETLKKFCAKTSFDVAYYPGNPSREKNFDQMAAIYRQQFEHPDQETESMSSNDFYHNVLTDLFAGKAESVYKNYIFDIRPARDDRPYYTAYFKPDTFGIFLPQLKEVADDWGYLLLWGTLIVSLIFALVIILLPLFGRWKELFSGKKGTVRVILYFACLGLGYMMVEIFLIQRLSLFLADPVYSVGIVISAMLVLSGIGSLFTGRFPNKNKLIIVAAGGIALSTLFYLFVLPSILEVGGGLPFFVKILISILVIAPSAFFLGMPFPTGLTTLSQKRPGLMPWAWGMNGALSVTGAMAAKLLSVSFGFSLVLAMVIVLYLGAAFLFPGRIKTE